MSTTAQEKQPDKIRWGFTLGFETQSLGIESFETQNPDQKSLFSESTYPGFTLGINGRKPIWRGVAFESGLSLSNNTNQVHFWPHEEQRYTFTDIELPLYISITNQKGTDRPLRGKILFGPRLGWNLAGPGDARFQLYQQRVGLDIGLGVEINLGKFKLFPSAIYSHGMNNIHDFTGTEYDFLAGRTVRDKVAFRVLFEGL